MMNSELFAVVGGVASALIAYAVLGLVVPFLRSLATDSLQGPLRSGEAETVQIVVTTPSGRDVTLPLRPDSEDSIRNFLQKAEAATGG